MRFRFFGEFRFVFDCLIIYGARKSTLEGRWIFGLFTSRLMLVVLKVANKRATISLFGVVKSDRLGCSASFFPYS